MVSVESYGVDAPVNALGQLVSTALTFGLAAVALFWVLSIRRREGITWPLFVLASGTLTCLMEPLFDHLYGLWFFVEGQWNLYTTFGSSQPVWVPAAYMAFYGGATVFIARALARRPEMGTVWRMYGATATMAIVAEMSYISILEVYSYQGVQPFVVLGYPIFLGFTNAMSALVSGIVVFRLAPLLRTPVSQLSLIPLVPGFFAMGLFGTGILYLSVRHFVDHLDPVLFHLSALTVVGGIAATVRLLGKLLVEGIPCTMSSRSPGITEHVQVPGRITP